MMHEQSQCAARVNFKRLSPADLHVLCVRRRRRFAPLLESALPPPPPELRL